MVLISMKTSSRLSFGVAGLLVGLSGGCLGLLLAGCQEPASGHVHVAATAVIMSDDYIYYPGSEVYYSPTHLYYYYRDGGVWVQRPQPPKVWVHDAPSVTIHLQDKPERHHPETVKQYPRDWHPAAKPSKDKEHHDNRDHDDREQHEQK